MGRIFTKNIKALAKTAASLDETLFHNANGYIGVRGSLEEGVPHDFNTMRGTYINGFYDIVDMKQAENLCNLIEKKETMLNVADTQTIYLTVNGEPFSLLTGDIVKCKRSLDMDEYKKAMAGVYTTSVNPSTIDESPMAYKSIDDIIDVIQDTVDIVDVMKPIYNFKAND